MTGAVKVRKCVAQKQVMYNRSKLNAGQTLFRPGDFVNVELEDYPRMFRHGKVMPIEETEIEKMKIDFDDVFPKTSSRIWVFGDGPTAPEAKKLIQPDDVVFAVNHCFWKPLKLRPDYYVALDSGMIEKEYTQIIGLTAHRKFTNRTNLIPFPDLASCPDFRFFDVLGEWGFSEDLLEVFHGKTSCFVALQLAAQCGRGKSEIHLGGIDLAILNSVDSHGRNLTHHYGTGVYQQELFPRMLASIRYGLNYLNERGVRWTNHSPLLASRIADLVKE